VNGDTVVEPNQTFFVNLTSAANAAIANGRGVGTIINDDIEMVGNVDFNGDGISDVGVYRDGTWFIFQPENGVQTAMGWGGAPNDVPVPADYDGDRKTDMAVYRDGVWFIRRSSDGGMTVVSWGGLAQDQPVQADYDGDGKTDAAIYRFGTWYILRSSDGGMTALSWRGLPQDIPLN